MIDVVIISTYFTDFFLFSMNIVAKGSTEAGNKLWVGT